jgi:carbon-monoxide dehydrogenase small subunit
VILSAKALLDHDPQPDDQSIREALAGHLCRCTGYSKMVEAVQDAAGMLREGERVPQGGAS